MRVISGALGGRTLLAPPDKGTRPAMGKLREALFSMLEARGVVWPGARVLDLFAGTGALAFECLSRGAEFAVLVEKGASAYAAKNALALGLAERCEIRDEDALKYLKRAPAEAFNLIFIDPPYRKNLAPPIFAEIKRRSLLAPAAYLVAELEVGADANPGLPLLVERNFGQTVLRVWQNGVWEPGNLAI